MSEQFLYFLQQMFNGVTLGSTYALIAIGYTMVYGIIGMINFAHGEVYMIGSYVSFMIIAALMMMGIDSSWLLVAAGFVGAIVIASAYGWSIERVAYRPVRSSKRLIALISAIGMSIFLQNYVSLTEGSRDVALPSLFNGQWIVGASENFSASVTTMQLVIWIVTFLAMLALRDCPDLGDWRGDGGGGGRVARPVLRRNQPVHRLYGRDESLHRRGTGRYRQHSGRDDWRPDFGRGRSALLGVPEHRI